MRVDDLALELERCTYCNARPGVWCRRYAREDPEHRGTPTGTANYLHAARTRRLYAFWREVYGEGVHDGIYGLERHLVRGLDTARPTDAYSPASVIGWIEQRAAKLHEARA